MMWWVMAVHDGAAKVFLPPFCVRHQGEARRMFRGSCNNRNEVMGQNPADFTLFAIGRYDDEMGKVEPIEPISMGNGLVYVGQAQEGGGKD